MNNTSRVTFEQKSQQSCDGFVYTPVPGEWFSNLDEVQVMGGAMEDMWRSLDLC